jgi:hypothetical protein
MLRKLTELRHCSDLCKEREVVPKSITISTKPLQASLVLSISCFSCTSSFHWTRVTLKNTFHSLPTLKFASSYFFNSLASLNPSSLRLATVICTLSLCSGALKWCWEIRMAQRAKPPVPTIKILQI